MDAYKTIVLVFTIYSLIAVVFGSITNILCAVTCFVTELRKNPSFIFIGTIALIDTTLLVSNTLIPAIQDIFECKITYASEWSFKASSYIGTSVLEISSLLMVK